MNIKLNFTPLLQKNIKIVYEPLVVEGILEQVIQKKDDISFVINGNKITFPKKLVFNSTLEKENGTIIITLYDESTPLDLKIVSGLVCFTMFDTYGFPIELTEEIVNEQGFLCDIQGFSVLRELQKQHDKNTFCGESCFKKI